MAEFLENIAGSIGDALGGLKNSNDKEGENAKLKEAEIALANLSNSVDTNTMYATETAFKNLSVTADEKGRKVIESILVEIKQDAVDGSIERGNIDVYLKKVNEVFDKRDLGFDGLAANLVEQFPDLVQIAIQWKEALLKDKESGKLNFIFGFFAFKAIDAIIKVGAEKTSTAEGGSNPEEGSSNTQTPEKAGESTSSRATGDADAIDALEKNKMEAFETSLTESLRANGKSLTVLELMSGKTEEIEDPSKALEFAGASPDAEKNLSMARMKMSHKYLSENAPEGMIIKVTGDKLEVKVGELGPRYFSVGERTENGLKLNFLTEGEKTIEWNGMLAELLTAIQKLDTTAT